MSSEPTTRAVGVPRDLSGVDAAWLTDALAKSCGDVRVDSVDVEQIAVGAGYIGLLGRVRPCYAGARDENTPSTLIVKLPSPEPGAQMLGAMLRLWEREGHFYRELAPTLSVRTPKCYLSEEDASDGRVVLLLEDLGHLESVDQLDGTTRTRAEHVIDWLADYHSATWGKADDPAFLSWVPRPSDPMFTGMEPLLGGNLPSFLTSFADLVTPARQALVEAVVADFASLLDPGDARFVVGHGDFRLDNMLFDADDRLAVLDWQLIHIAPGTYDLTYFIVESLTTDQRREWEADLVERYRARLSANTGEALDADELREGYRDGVRFLLSLMPVTQMLDFEVNDRSRALATAIVGRVFAAVEDHH